jgi:glycosyltransferase involved in cell wall biosynthesis
MSNLARVSVVIPARGQQDNLHGAVRSALASDLQELEVIVVDNGATERCATIVAAARDTRVVTVRLRPGRGASRPRNVGVARARAPLVAFLDPDDLLKPDALSASVHALECTSEAGFAFSDFEYIDGTGKVIRPTGFSGFADTGIADPPRPNNWQLIKQGHLARTLLYKSVPGISGMVVRRDVLTDVGPFDEVAVDCADLDMLFRLAHGYDALYSDSVGHSRREDSRVREGCGGRGANKDCIAVLRLERGRWSDRGARRQLNRRIAQHLADIAREERQRQHRLRSGVTFAYAFAMSPESRWLRAMLRSIL